jgi:hypothetical protein
MLLKNYHLKHGFWSKVKSADQRKESYVGRSILARREWWLQFSAVGYNKPCKDCTNITLEEKQRIATTHKERRFWVSGYLQGV